MRPPSVPPRIAVTLLCLALAGSYGRGWTGSGSGAFGPGLAAAAQEFDITIPTTAGDTTETFWLQIPDGYQPGRACPLLIGWHQLGGDRFEMKNGTTFDTEANARTWIAASHDGPTPTHWNNQVAQSHVVDMIRWIEGHFTVDPARIYMVGGSMGGASGMVFSNNHLDPAGPMVAAAASVSGIQDCDRRFHEQGINHSMIGAFGGTPDEVPFEYHRNSAIYFADSTRSMHLAARHLPLFLTFGHGVSDSVWRAHAEDLYAAMRTYADSVVLHESARNGHGWSAAEPELICDFLGGFTLDPLPLRISVAADEDGRSWWADLRLRAAGEPFGRLEAWADPSSARLGVTMLRNVQAADLDLLPLGFPLNGGSFTCRWEVLDGLPAELGFAGVSAPPSVVLRDGVPDPDWSYDAGARRLVLLDSGSAIWTVHFAPSGVVWDPDGRAATADPQRLEILPGLGAVRYRLQAAGPLAWEMLDVLGRRVWSGRRFRPAGDGELRPRPSIPSGAYVLVLRSGGAHATTRLVVVR